MHGAGSWSTPGGHLDFGESPEACAIREAKEETNVTVSNVRFRAVTNDFFADEGKHYITLWLEGDYAGGEPVVNAAYEMAEVGWFAWDALPQPLFLSLRQLLDGAHYPPKNARPPVTQLLNEEGRALWDQKAAFWDGLHGDEGNQFHRRLVAPAAVSHRSTAGPCCHWYRPTAGQIHIKRKRPPAANRVLAPRAGSTG